MRQYPYNDTSTRRVLPSEQDRRDLLPQRHRRDLGLLRLLHSGDARDEVHLVRLPDACALDDLPADVQRDEEGHVDVRGEEAGRGEPEEHVEPVDEDEDRDPEDAPVRQPRLQRRVV